MQEKEKAVKIIEKLIADEVEAIEGYHEAIEELKKGCPRYIEAFARIYSEEVRHMSELEMMLKDIKVEVEEDDPMRVFGI